MVAINYAKDIRVGEQPVKAAALGSYFVWPPLPERLFFRGQALAYDFANQRYGVRLPDDTITYTTNVNDLGIVTRASTATYWGPEGSLLEAAVDEARIQHVPETGKGRGLLVESEATNLVTNQDITGWSLYKGVLDFGVVEETDAFFGLPAYRLEGENTTLSTSYAVGSTLSNSVIDRKYTVSVYVKSLGASSVRVRLSRTAAEAAGGGHFRVTFNFATKVLNPHIYNFSNFTDITYDYVKAEFVGEGWYRLILGGIQFRPPEQGGPVSAGFLKIYPGGDPDSDPEGSAEDRIMLALPQVEPGSQYTSPIPTTDSPVTRAADNAEIDLSDVFNPDEGTLRITAQVPEGEVVASLGDMRVVSDSDELKAYDLNYLFHSENTVAQLGEGIFNKVEYFPEMQGETDLGDLIRTLYGNGEQGAMYIPKPKVHGQQVLWQDVEGTVPVVSDGDPVFVADDLSGLPLINPSAEISTSRPTWKSNNSLKYDGIDDVLVGKVEDLPENMLFASPDNPFFVVCAFRRDTGSFATNNTVFSRAEGGVGERIFLVYLQSGGRMRVEIRGENTGADGLYPTVSGWNVVALNWDGSVMTLRNERLESHNINVGSSENDASDFYLGARTRTSFNWGGSIGTFAYRNAAMTTEQQEDVITRIKQLHDEWEGV